MRAVRNILSACANFLHGCRNIRTLCRYILNLCTCRRSEFSRNLRSEKALLLSNCNFESYQPREESKLSRIYLIPEFFFF